MANRYKRHRLLRRDKHICGLHMGGCGKPIRKGETYNVDHIIPKALFSKTAADRIAEFNEDWNCQPMHVECNDSKAYQLRTWPRFDCKCHYLQVYDSDLYICTKDDVSDGRHKLLNNIVSTSNDKVDAKLVIGSGISKRRQDIRRLSGKQIRIHTSRNKCFSGEVVQFD